MSVDPSRKTWIGQSTLVHQYASANNASQPWLAVFQGCCRSDELGFLGAGSRWYIETGVNTAIAQFSPEVQLLPLVTVRAQGGSIGGDGIFYIAANDPGKHPTQVSTGSKLRWSFDQRVNALPPGIIIEALTGKVTASLNNGTYALTVIVQEVDTGTSTVRAPHVASLSGAAPLPV